MTIQERTSKEQIAKDLAARMNSDEATANAWIDGFVETLFDNFKVGQSVTIKGFGSFYVREGHGSMVFKFTPGARLKAILGWSSSYRGPL